ncbi:MAG: hypothetical protein ACJAYJ_004297, partial [Saprospiraceae bacterium]
FNVLIDDANKRGVWDVSKLVSIDNVTGNLLIMSCLCSTTGIDAAAVDLRAEIADEGSTYIEDNNIDRSKNILISQSMGGLVARQLDRKYVEVYGEDERRFGGLISFCGPNQGAQVINNADLDGPAMVNEFGERGIVALAKGPVTEVLVNIENEIESTLSGLIPPIAKVLSFAVGPVFGAGVLVIDNQLDDINLNFSDYAVDFLTAIVGGGLDLAIPVLFSDFLTNNATDHAVGAPFLNELNEFDTNIPMVAVYSEEIDPVFWRVVSSFTEDTPHNFDAFQATDETWVDKADTLAARYELKENDMNLDYAVRFAWGNGADWLNGANDQWKTIIGARTPITSGSGGICYCYESSGPLPDLSYSAATPADCGLDLAIECNWYSNVIIVDYEEKPSDGVVLVESAQDLPGMLTKYSDI